MTNLIKTIFYINSLSIIMMILTVFIGISIASFASRYMKGDVKFRSFFTQLFFLILSILIMVSTDHLALLLISWCISNTLLIKLMVHKSSWKPAKYSGIITAKHFLLGSVCMASCFLILWLATGTCSIRTILETNLKSYVLLPALVLLLIGAMTQSAIWPFHRWLISSLNSPTPVSAMMHAGLVNGGGFLLAKFAPLFFGCTKFLTLIFLVGMFTAFLGTLWKLIQNDIKRTLGCSTMGQMGFMLAQCGLGFFPAALAHLVTHGMFKAYLFLSSGYAAQETRYDKKTLLSKGDLFLATVCGVTGSLCFSFISGKSWLSNNTTLVLMILVLLNAISFSAPILTLKHRYRFFISIALTCLMNIVYGAIVLLLSKSLDSLHILEPQPLNIFHTLAIGVMVLSWAAVILLKNGKVRIETNPSIQRLYVSALNSSQPDPLTVTTSRNDYKYL